MSKRRHQLPKRWLTAILLYLIFAGTEYVQTPSWFKQALAAEAEVKFLECHGARLAYRHWQNSGSKSLVLVHGHAAHAHWWDFIAPHLAAYDIIAVDLSGCGDSEHRSQYSAELFAEEILACSEHAGQQLPVLIGHSFGGAMSRVTAYLYPEAFAGLILVDSALSEKTGSRNPPSLPRQRDRVYATREIAMRRFRLRPPQPCENSYIVEHIAYHSIRQDDDGYRFKLDPAIFAKMPGTREFPASANMFRDLRLNKGIIYGELSRFFQGDTIDLTERCVGGDYIEKIASAYHHVFLDQPLLFVEALNRLLQRFS